VLQSLFVGLALIMSTSLISRQTHLTNCQQSSAQTNHRTNYYTKNQDIMIAGFSVHQYRMIQTTSESTTYTWLDSFRLHRNPPSGNRMIQVRSRFTYMFRMWSASLVSSAFLVFRPCVTSRSHKYVNSYNDIT